MYIAIVDYDNNNRVTKYQDYKTKAEADAHVARVIDRFPKAFVASDPGGGFAAWLVDPTAKTISSSPHVETEQERKDKLRVEKDFETMKQAVLDVTLSWAHLENSMAFLLESIISRSNYQFGFAIYFSVASAEARFNIIDKAINELFEKQKNTRNLLTHEDSERLEGAWKKLFEKLGKVKTTRNKVTHGNILPIRKKATSKTHVRLTPPMFHLDMMKQWSRPELPGLSVKEVQQGAKRIVKIGGLLVFVTMIVTQLLHDDASTLVQTINKLEDGLQNIVNSKSKKGQVSS